MLPSKFFNESATLIKHGDTIRYNGNINNIELIGNWPDILCKMVIEVTAISGHTDCNGSIKINDESLTFTASGQKNTTIAFLSSKPTITVTGLDCGALITLVDEDDTEINTETSTTIAVDWDDITKTWYQSAGKWEMSTPSFLTPDLTTKIDDGIIHDGKNYVVKNVSSADTTLGGRVINVFVQL